MNDTLQKLLIALVPGIITAIMTAVITVNLSLKKFRHEKIWEKKIDSYTSIMQGLVDIKIIAEKAVDTQHDESSSFTDEEIKDMHDSIMNAYQLLEKAIGTGEFIISRKSIEVLCHLRDELHKLEPDDDSKGLALIDESIQKFRNLARKDLKI